MNEVLGIVFDFNAVDWTAAHRLQLRLQHFGHQKIIPHRDSQVDQDLVKQCRGVVGFKVVWQAVLQLLSFYKIQNDNCELAFIGVTPHECRFLFTGFLCKLDLQQLTKSALQMMQNQSNLRPIDIARLDDEDSMLSGALSKMLCYMNSKHQLNSSAVARQKAKRCRILFFDVGPESAYSSQHLSSLNCAFAAEKMGIVIDGVNLNLSASASVQQVCHVAGGTLFVYSQRILESEKPVGSPASSLIAFLLFHFPCPTLNEGDLVAKSMNAKMDSAPICMCHNKRVSLARLCSCCLAIYCEEFNDAICYFCNARFRRDKPGAQPFARKRQKS